MTERDAQGPETYEVSKISTLVSAVRISRDESLFMGFDGFGNPIMSNEKSDLSENSKEVLDYSDLAKPGTERVFSKVSPVKFLAVGRVVDKRDSKDIFRSCRIGDGERSGK